MLNTLPTQWRLVTAQWQKPNSARTYPSLLAHFPDQRSIDTLCFYWWFTIRYLRFRNAPNFDENIFLEKLSDVYNQVQYLSLDSEGNVSCSAFHANANNEWSKLFVPSNPKGALHFELHSPISSERY